MTEQPPPPPAISDEAPADSDHVIRAITEPDNFRVMVAITTSLARSAIAAQGATGATAEHFADLLTGAVLIRETMSPAHRVQAILKAEDGGASLIADAHPDGLTRGLVQLRDDQPFAIRQGGTLLMMRQMSRGMHRSLVQPAAGASVPQALMTYLSESEQIVAMMDTAQVWRDGKLLLAGGYVVQVLPDADRAMLAIMAQRIEDFPPLPELLERLDGSARGLMDELLYGMPYTQLADSNVHFGCRCSEQAVVGTLATLGREDIAELLRDQDVVELSCDYCHRTYNVGRAQLQGLLATS